MTYIKKTANRIVSRYQGATGTTKRVISHHQSRTSAPTYSLDMAAVHRNAMR